MTEAESKETGSVNEATCPKCNGDLGMMLEGLRKMERKHQDQQGKGGMSVCVCVYCGGVLTLTQEGFRVLPGEVLETLPEELQGEVSKMVAKAKQLQQVKRSQWN